ncbi:class I SAM-dependent methyltransferase [Pelagibius sp. CAU 1746]|uniref:class I SAM-dependent methyltransferase n=1 Tax=Pelagibius sp. CAU 1746 TaxID=3140370 RepID=UPI00325B3E39
MTDDRLFPATAMPDRDWWQALWPDPEGVLRRLGLRAGLTVADLCCGDGYFTAALARLVRGRVYAVDLDPAMLTRARREVEGAGASVLEYIAADARELAKALPETVDCVLMANTFHGVPEQTALARAVAATLKPGGRFIVINWHTRPRGETTVLGQPRGPKTELRMAPERLRGAVEPAGFELESLLELPPYHYGAAFRRS